LPIPLTCNGPDLDALERLCQQRRVKAVYTMPTLHNPMGWVMDVSWRARLIAIARHHDALLIEDAAYAFLVEDAPPPLKALAPELTVADQVVSELLSRNVAVSPAEPFATTSAAPHAIRLALGSLDREALAGALRESPSRQVRSLFFRKEGGWPHTELALEGRHAMRLSTLLTLVAVLSSGFAATGAAHAADAEACHLLPVAESRVALHSSQSVGVLYSENTVSTLEYLERYHAVALKGVKNGALDARIRDAFISSSDPKLAVDWLKGSLQKEFASVTVYENLDALMQARPDVVINQQRDLQINALKQFDASLKALVTTGHTAEVASN
nr:hypothetical protein [Tanacetum cinerariifolium]